MHEAYRNMYEALGVKNINVILPPPQKPAPMDPAMENIMAKYYRVYCAKILW